MAATVTPAAGQSHFQSIGSLVATFIEVTLATNDYVTGGIDFSSELPGGTSLHGAIVVQSTGTGGLTQIPVIDRVNKKLVLLKGTAGVNAEVSNGTSDAQVVRILALSS